MCRYEYLRGGVHHFRVLNNVAYDNMGHAFFIEDAAETYNRIEGNLAMVTKSSSSLLDTDTTPASFWITHPTNYFVGNVAAGSERYGYWFDLQKFAVGPSADESVCPPGSPLGSFENNRAHSNGRYGLRIFNHWVPRAKPCDWRSAVSSANPLVPTELVNFTSYKNGRTGAIGSLIGDIKFKNFRVADNQRAGIEVTDVVSGADGAGVFDALIVAASENQPWPVAQDRRTGRGTSTDSPHPLVYVSLTPPPTRVYIFIRSTGSEASTDGGGRRRMTSSHVYFIIFFYFFIFFPARQGTVE